MKKFAIIGGGAAGFFCAAALGRLEGLETTIFEASPSPMQKLLLTGGGRCNFTNSAIDKFPPADFYPRGASFLRKSLRRFGARNVESFFADIGVANSEESDGRVFPASSRASDIVDALLSSAKKNGVKLVCRARANAIKKIGGQYEIIFSNSEVADSRIDTPHKFVADYVLVALGGSWSDSLKKSMEEIGHTFSPALPSLYSLKLDCASNAQWKELSGACSQNAELSATFDSGKTTIHAGGALLITHFGIGGPCTLKFSSFGARHFAACGYNFPLSINFAASFDERRRNEEFAHARKAFAKKQIKNTPLFDITKSAWEFAVQRSFGDSTNTWANFSDGEKKELEKNIFSFRAQCIGRSNHAEEFVTCGGIHTEEVESSSGESKVSNGLYFAGECLDIDGITGGYNLHAAWATGRNTAESIRREKFLG